MQRFKVRLRPGGTGGRWTIFHVPFDVGKKFGSCGRVSVRGTINGFEYRSSIFPDGDAGHFMMVNKAMQAAAKVAQGETVNVTMAIDDAPREVQVPAELSRAMKKDVEAQKRFQSLSPSCRREYADWVSQARKQQTRDHRAESAVEMLRAGRKRLKM